MFKNIAATAATLVNPLLVLNYQRALQRASYQNGVRRYASGPMKDVQHITAKTHRIIQGRGTAYEDPAARPQRLLMLKKRAERRAAR